MCKKKYKCEDCGYTYIIDETPQCVRCDSKNVEEIEIKNEKEQNKADKL